MSKHKHGPARQQPAKGHHPHRAEPQAAQRQHPRPMRKPVRRTPTWVAPVATVGGLAVVVVAFLAIRYLSTPNTVPPPPPDTTAQVIATITSLPPAELDQVGAGTANNVIQKVPPGAPLVGPSGHPLVFYYGAEFCPYCAAERWAIIVALSRFGTFSGLKTTTSSSTDIYPNTPTFTFHGATFTSQYIDFQAVEASDREQRFLESPTQAQKALITKYDSSGTIPFVVLGNRFIVPRASYQPDVIGGMTWQDIANALKNPDSSQAKSVLGSANLLTAAICSLTSNQPSTACTPSIQALEAKL